MVVFDIESNFDKLKFLKGTTIKSIWQIYLYFLRIITFGYICRK